MKFGAYFALLVGLTACGGNMDESDFIDGYLTESCRIATECAEEDDFVMFESTSECVTFMKLFGGSSIGTGCEYNGKEAKTCLTYLEGLTCDSTDSLDETPAECAGVYTGECAFTGATPEDTGGGDTDDTDDTDSE